MDMQVPKQPATVVSEEGPRVHVYLQAADIDHLCAAVLIGGEKRVHENLHKDTDNFLCQ
jgi:hypothetical protein